jgi:hypothetical protein
MNAFARHLLFRRAVTIIRSIGVIFGLLVFSLLYVCALATRDLDTYIFEIGTAVATVVPLLTPWRNVRHPILWWGLFLYLFVVAFNYAWLTVLFVTSPSNDGSFASSGVFPGLITLILLLQVPAILALRFEPLRYVPQPRQAR